MFEKDIENILANSRIVKKDIRLLKLSKMIEKMLWKALLIIFLKMLVLN